MGDFGPQNLGSMPLQGEMVASFAGSGNEASEIDGEIIPYIAQSSFTNGVNVSPGKSNSLQVF